MPLFYDATYILVIIGSILLLLAQAKVRSSYSKYSKILNRNLYTGRQVAEAIIAKNGLNVTVQEISGELTDHYDPSSNTLRLSSEIYNGTTIASMSVAAHECGHALQHAEGYGFLSFRSAILPFANGGSTLGWIAVMIGLFIGSSPIAYIGLGMLSLMLVFQVVTLPVEFNASARALNILQTQFGVGGEELSGSKSMLTAAALTYVAAVASTLLSLLRILILITNNSRRR